MATQISEEITIPELENLSVMADAIWTELDDAGLSEKKTLAPVPGGLIVIINDYCELEAFWDSNTARLTIMRGWQGTLGPHDNVNTAEEIVSKLVVSWC